jgi:hypothetical protein
VSKSKKSRSEPHLGRAVRVPLFTQSIDAKVPAENIIQVEFLKNVKRWLAVSEASDGRVFHGTGNTEALARRAAGLRTFAYLRGVAEGRADGVDQVARDAAKTELAQHLEELAAVIAGYNGVMPIGMVREVVAFQVRHANEIMRKSEDRTLIARVALPVLLFVSAAFAEGVIGAYSEK